MRDRLRISPWSIAAGSIKWKGSSSLLRRRRSRRSLTSPPEPRRDTWSIGSKNYPASTWSRRRPSLMCRTKRKSENNNSRSSRNSRSRSWRKLISTIPSKFKPKNNTWPPWACQWSKLQRLWANTRGPNPPRLRRKKITTGAVYKSTMSPKWELLIAGVWDFLTLTWTKRS